MSVHILITGATGFIGSRVASAARQLPDVQLRLMARRPGALDTSASESTFQAALTDPDSLRGICDGVDVLIHCAAHIGGPSQLAEAVNEHGTRSLVAEAQRAGVRRIVQVSTAAVYGRGVFRHAEPVDLRIAPASATSRTRAEAERIVLEAGGTVLRPHLVFGAGDRWVVPGLVELHRKLSASVDGWGARLSVIDVDDLARAVVATATAPHAIPGVRHLTHPDPVTCAEVFDSLVGLLDLPPAQEDICLAEARRRLTGDAQALHHLDMLATDHWFAGERLWAESGCPAGSGLADTLNRHGWWYRRLLERPTPSAA